MKAAVFLAPNTPFEIRDISIDKPAADEVLVRVAASGLCHSDWHYMTGGIPIPVPAVLGHEVAGVVEQVGENVRHLAPGDHVVSCALVFCGRCEQCVNGHASVCQAPPARDADEPPRLSLQGTRVQQGIRTGGFAEQILVHHSGLVKIDHAMPLDRAALLGCGVLTGLGAIFHSAKVVPGSKLVVIGCGGVGLSVIQGARIAGAGMIMAVDLNDDKKDIAKHFGATHFISGPDAVAEVLELSGGGVDYAFEVVGNPATITQGVRMLKSRGLLTMVGVTKADAELSIPGLPMVLKELRIQGTFFGSAPFTVDIPKFVGMYQSGKLDLDTMISERIGLEDINRGYADMIRGQTTARKVITFDDVLASATATG